MKKQFIDTSHHQVWAWTWFSAPLVLIVAHTHSSVCFFYIFFLLNLCFYSLGLFFSHLASDFMLHVNRKILQISFIFSLKHPVKFINVEKMYYKKWQFIIFGDLLILDNVISAIAISVHFKMDKPLDCSVDLEDERPVPTSVKCDNMLEQATADIKFLLCLSRTHEVHLIWKSMLR